MMFHSPNLDPKNKIERDQSRQDQKKVENTTDIHDLSSVLPELQDNSSRVVLRDRLRESS